jgi:hypothetical protein
MPSNDVAAQRKRRAQLQAELAESLTRALAGSVRTANELTKKRQKAAEDPSASLPLKTVKVPSRKRAQLDASIRRWERLQTAKAKRPIVPRLNIESAHAATRAVSKASPRDVAIGVTTTEIKERMLQQAEDMAESMDRAAQEDHSRRRSVSARARYRLGQDYDRTSWLGASTAHAIALEQESLAGRMRVERGTLTVRGGFTKREMRQLELEELNKQWVAEQELASRPRTPQAVGAATAIVSHPRTPQAVGAHRSSPRRVALSAGPHDPAGDGRLLALEARAGTPLSRPMISKWRTSPRVSIGSEPRFVTSDTLYISRSHSVAQSRSATLDATIAGSDQASTSFLSNRESSKAVSMAKSPRFDPPSLGVDSPGVGEYAGRVEGQFPPPPLEPAEDLPSIQRGVSSSVVSVIRRTAAPRLQTQTDSSTLPLRRPAQPTSLWADPVVAATSPRRPNRVIVAKRSMSPEVQRAVDETMRVVSVESERATQRQVELRRQHKERLERAALRQQEGGGDKEVLAATARSTNLAHIGAVRELEESLRLATERTAKLHSETEDASTVNEEWMRSTNAHVPLSQVGQRQGVRPTKPPRVRQGFGSSAVRPVNARVRSSVRQGPSPADHGGEGWKVSSHVLQSTGASFPRGSRNFEASLVDSARLGDVDAPAVVLAAKAAAVMENPLSNLREEVFNRPGPGAYDPLTALAALKPQPPQVSMGGTAVALERLKAHTSDTPGPGAYPKATSALGEVGAAWSLSTTASTLCASFAKASRDPPPMVEVLDASRLDDTPSATRRAWERPTPSTESMSPRSQRAFKESMSPRSQRAFKESTSPRSQRAFKEYQPRPGDVGYFSPLSRNPTQRAVGFGKAARDSSKQYNPLNKRLV